MNLRILIFSILFFASSHLLGQTSGYLSGSATANLIIPLSIESGYGDLDFGDILATGTPSREEIKPANGKEFIVKGQANRSISVVFNDVELNNLEWVSKTGGVSGILTFVPEVLLNNSQTVSSGDNIILQPEGLAGEIKLNVGGKIDIKANQPVGDYEGLFIISVSY